MYDRHICPSVFSIHERALGDVLQRDVPQPVARRDGWIPIDASGTGEGEREVPHAPVELATVGWVGVETTRAVVAGERGACREEYNIAIA